jgi:hypothetical protein
VNVLLITHKLNNRFRDYSSFYETIKGSCNEWWHYFDTTWIVTTNHSAYSFSQLLLSHIEEADRLLVIKVRKDYQGWLEADAWEWLNNKTF